jgi:hypothetical protein
MKLISPRGVYEDTELGLFHTGACLQYELLDLNERKIESI